MIPVHAALNHLLRQNAWAADKLRPQAGKTLKLELPPVAVLLTLIDSGEFVPAVEAAEPDATLVLRPMGALRRALGQPLQNGDFHIEGDVALATEVGKVLQQLEWEAEEDLSRLIGDAPANELLRFGRRALDEGRRQVESVAGMFAEYWLEEQPLIAKQRHLAQFATEVDCLRDDVARLEKRLAQLEATRR